jgi:hypothetical protein
MPAAYPGAIPAKPTINTADMSAATAHSVDRGLLWDELRAGLLELGTTPSGSFSTVKLRLEDIETDVAAAMPKSGGAFTGAVSGLLPVSSNHLATKGYVDSNFLPLAGIVAMTGQLNGTTASFSGNVSADTATGASHLMRKDQTDTALALKANLASPSFTGTVTMAGPLDHNGSSIGFLGAAPVTVRTLGAAASDPATTQTLANNIRTALIQLGLGQP